MSLQDISEEHLKQKLVDLEKKNDLSYEQLMILLVINSLPFTVWASDRNFRIRFWNKTCENLYGYSKEEAIGKNFVSLFVREEQTLRAEKDHLDIIDNGKHFHYVTYDKTKDGRVLPLIINCSRVYDILSGEPLNAEIGMTFDFLDEEKERLNKKKTEFRKVKDCIEQFIETTNQFKEEFRDRRRTLLKAIKDTTQKVITDGKETKVNFQKRTIPIVNILNDLQSDLTEGILAYLDIMQSYDDSKDCESLRIEFNQRYDMITEEYEEAVLQYYEINSLFNYDSTNTSIKENLYNEIKQRNFLLYERAYKLKMTIEKKIEDFLSLDGINDNSPIVVKLNHLIDETDNQRTTIDTNADNLRKIIFVCNEKEKLEEILLVIRKTFDKLEQDITNIENDCKEVV